MTAKFTKGPWKPKGMSIMYPDNDGEYVMPVAHVSRMNFAEVDAALIACAPEMYEMLETILQVFEMDHRTTTDVISLLEKARGEA
jgi:hypothetical protein